MSTLVQPPKNAPVFAGESLAGAKRYIFQAGTTTPLATYTTTALSVEHAHPIVADAEGVFPAIYVNGAAYPTYRDQLKTSADALKWDVDNVPAEADAGNNYVTSVGGTANLITLTPSTPIAAYAEGQSFEFIADFANTGAVSVAVSGLAYIAIRRGSDELVAGDIVSGGAVHILYDGAQFQILTPRSNSGTFTPTCTAVTNVAVCSGGQSQWMRTGDICAMWGTVTIDPTSTGSTVIRFTLPVASNFGSAAQLNGLAANAATGGRNARIEADATNDQALLTWTADDVSSAAWYYSLAYRIV